MKHYDVEWTWLLGFVAFVTGMLLIERFHRFRAIRKSRRKHRGFRKFKSNHQRIRERTARMHMAGIAPPGGANDG
jgi:hypothetical protein